MVHVYRDTQGNSHPTYQQQRSSLGQYLASPYSLAVCVTNETAKSEQNHSWDFLRPKLHQPMVPILAFLLDHMPSNGQRGYYAPLIS